MSTTAAEIKSGKAAATGAVNQIIGNLNAMRRSKEFLELSNWGITMEINMPIAPLRNRILPLCAISAAFLITRWMSAVSSKLQATRQRKSDWRNRRVLLFIIQILKAMAKEVVLHSITLTPRSRVRGSMNQTSPHRNTVINSSQSLSTMPWCHHRSNVKSSTYQHLLTNNVPLSRHLACIVLKRLSIVKSFHNSRLWCPGIDHPTLNIEQHG